MADGIYVAFTGALGKARQLETLSGNFANMDTTGYREGGVAFSSVLKQVLEMPALQPGVEPPSPRLLALDKLHLQASESYTRLEKGPLHETGNPLDLAIEQDACFLVRTPAGPVALPSGSFHVDEGNRIVDAAGNPLLAEGNAELIVPPGELISIYEDGAVWAGEEQIGTLALVRLTGPVQKLGSSYLQGILEPLGPAEVMVRQGWLEASNVDPLRSLTGLIEVHRSFESLQTVIQTYRQLDHQVISEVGRKSSV